MRLYSYITNENYTEKQQGGNKRIDIDLLIEKERGQWRSDNDKVKIFLLWNDGKPTIHFEIPDGWKAQKTTSEKVIQFIRQKPLETMGNGAMPFKP